MFPAGNGHTAPHFGATGNLGGHEGLGGELGIQDRPAIGALKRPSASLIRAAPERDGTATTLNAPPHPGRSPV